MSSSSGPHPTVPPSMPFTAPACDTLLPRTVEEYSITADDVNFIMDICARVEAESLVSRRMSLRDLKHRTSRSGRLSRAFDIDADVEKSLHLIECLPQGSRGADPPSEEFLQLSKAVSSTFACPRSIVEKALLFEEFAIQLLGESDSQFESQHTRATRSPWLIMSDVEHRTSAQSEVALSKPDEWLVRRICKLFGADPPFKRQSRVEGGVDHSQMEEIRDRRRYRKRRRKERVRGNAVDPTTVDNDDICEYYSSDNYSDMSDGAEVNDNLNDDSSED